MSVRKIFSLVLVSLLFFHCQTDEEDEQNQNQIDFIECEGTIFSNGTIVKISDSEIRVTSQMDAIGPEKIIQHGHLIKKGQAASLLDFDDLTSLGEKSIVASFTSTFTDLDHSSTYYIAAYIEMESGACIHTTVATFQTPVKTFASVRTLSFDAKSNNVVDVTGVIDNTFNKTVSRFGFVYTAGNNDPDFDNAILISGENLSNVSSHTFTESINDLLVDRIYSISAFAENDAGITLAEPIKIHRDDFDFSKFDIPDAAFTDVLIESFDDNSNGWFDGTSPNGNIYDMRSGYYRINTIDDEIGQTTFSNPLNILEGLDNYQIDLILDFNSGGYDSSTGLRFEGDDSFQEYLFGVRREEVLLGYWNNLEIYQNLLFEMIDLNSSNNLLTVRKAYGKFYLFVNQTLVIIFDDDKFDGHSVRLRVGSDTTVDFEEFTIRKLI